MNIPKLITIQGSARGGKGTLAHALYSDLQSDYRVHVIDQGLKFRILASVALAAGIDKEDIDGLTEFIGLEATRTTVVNRLIEAASWTKSERETVYYMPEISNASGMVGKISTAHDVAVTLLVDEVKAVANDYDIILVDGRALQKYGKLLEDEKIVEYILAIDVHCDAFVSAQRETKIFSEDAAAYTPEQTMQLLVATRDIARRNSSDARRTRDPSLPIRGAYDFDVLHEMDDTEKTWVVDAVRATKSITVDNSNTRTPEQLTAPVISLVRALI
jgi:cytidylate kinase